MIDLISILPDRSTSYLYKYHSNSSECEVLQLDFVTLACTMKSLERRMARVDGLSLSPGRFWIPTVGGKQEESDNRNEVNK